MKDKVLLSPYFVRYAPVAALTELASGFTVSAYNRTDADYEVFFTPLKQGKPTSSKPIWLCKNPAGEMLFVRSRSLKSESGQPLTAGKDYDMVLIHSVPSALIQAPYPGYDAKIEVSRGTVAKHGYGSDTYVEYLGQNGTPSMAVGFHGLLWNMPGEQAKNATLIQGAKGIISPAHRTYLLLMHTSGSIEHTGQGVGSVRLVDANGKTVESVRYEVPAFSYKLIELGAELRQKATSMQYYNVLGSAPHHTLLPFIVVHALDQDCMFIEHGVVPADYLHGYQSSQKVAAAKHLHEKSVMEMH